MTHDLKPKDTVQQKQITRVYLVGKVRRIKPNGRVSVRWTHKRIALHAAAEPITPFYANELADTLERI